MNKVALVLISSIALLSVAAGAREGGPTFQRPQELSIFATTLFNGTEGFGTAIPTKSPPDVIGGAGSAFVTGIGGSSLQYPEPLPPPTNVSDSFGKAVMRLTVRKQNSPEGLDGAINVFDWLLVADDHTVHVYSNVVFRYNDSNPTQVIANDAGDATDYALASTVQVSGAPKGTTIKNLIEGSPRSDAMCVYSDFLVTGSSTTQGYYALFSHKGRVPLEQQGEFEQRQDAIVISAPGFGESVSQLDDQYVIGAPLAGKVYIYRLGPLDGATCSYGLVEVNVITSAASGFGMSVSREHDMFLRRDVLVVGAPHHEGSGRVFVYTLKRDGTDENLVQTIEPPEDEDNSIVPEVGMHFGYAVQFRGSNFLAIGAPGYAQTGHAFFYQLNDTNGELEYEFPFDVHAVPSGARFGSSISANCKLFHFGLGPVEYVATALFNQGAFYDDYCTCKPSPRENVFASPREVDGEVGACEAVEATSRSWSCDIEGQAPNICNYVSSTFWTFAEPTAPGALGRCVRSKALNRAPRLPNCFYDYGSVY